MSAKRLCAATVVGLSLVLPIMSGPRAQTLSPTNSLVLLAPGEIKWAPTNRSDTQRAALWGDSASGAFAFFSRYDGGWELPLHFHTNDLQGLIISGTFVVQAAGRPPKALPAGSYFFVPGKTHHTDLCVPGPPCIVYFTGNAPLDRVNVSVPVAQ